MDIPEDQQSGPHHREDQAVGGYGFHRPDLQTLGVGSHHVLLRRPVSDICNLGQDQDDDSPGEEESHGMGQAITHPFDPVEPT